MDLQEGPSSFSKEDLNILMEALPEARRSKQVEDILVKALIAGFTLAYLLDCIAYSDDKANGNFLGYQSHHDFDQFQEQGKHFVCRIKAKTVRTVIEKHEINSDSYIFYDSLVSLGTPNQNQTKRPVRVVGYKNCRREILCGNGQT